MMATMNQLVYGNSRNPNLILDVVRLGDHCLRSDSKRLWELKREFSRYNTLRQEAAKDRMWTKMLRIICGLQVELSQERAAK